MTSQQPRSIFQSGYLLAAMALGAFLWTPFATAATMEEIALLKSAGRQKILVDGAKKEARLMFYTALIVDQVVRPMKAAFEKEYPFIQLEFFRANSDRLGQKILTEYQAKRYDVDVISGSGATTVARQAGYLQKFLSPHSAEYPAELKDPQGFWGVSNVYFMTLGYNSRMVKPNERAKNLRGSAQSALEKSDDVVDKPHLGSAAFHRQRAADNGRQRRQVLSAKVKSAKYRQ